MIVRVKHPIVNDANGETPRMGGHEFQMDAQTGLWRSTSSPDLNPWITLQMPTFAGNWSVAPSELPKPPATASALWDNPETQTTEILAFRGWDYELTLDGEGVFGVQLESPHQDYVWDGPVVRTTPPASDAEHGFYAVGIAPHCQNNWESYIGGNTIWGRVALSGVVVEGRTGYRAEQVAIQELWVNPARWSEDDDESDHITPEGLCRHLAEKYQCDVSVRKPQWRDLVRGKYGTSLV